MDYEIYHDESKEHGYWHGILLVPTDTKPLIIQHLKQVREQTRYQDPLGIKNVKSFGKVFDCSEAWIDFVIGSMITKFSTKDPYPIFTGERIKGKKQYAIFKEIVQRNYLGVKFILSRDREQFENMYDSLDYGDKVVISFQIVAKGGFHYIFSEDNYARIIKIHFDGHRHYGHNIDPEKINNRLKGLRNYCQLKENCPIDDRSSDHRKDDSQKYEDCQLIQLTDLFVGSFRTAFGFLGQGKKPAQKQLARPVKELIKRHKKGYARMKNSRWRNSFCISESFIEDGNWRFQDIEYSERRDKQNRTLWNL